MLPLDPGRATPEDQHCYDGATSQLHTASPNRENLIVLAVELVTPVIRRVSVDRCGDRDDHKHCDNDAEDEQAQSFKYSHPTLSVARDTMRPYTFWLRLILN